MSRRTSLISRVLCISVLCVTFSSIAFASPITHSVNFGRTIPAAVAFKRAHWLTQLGVTVPETTIDFETGFTHHQHILGQELDGGCTISTTTGGYGFVTTSAREMGGTPPFGTYALAVDENNGYRLSFSDPVSYLTFTLLDNDRTPMTINYTDGTTDAATIQSGLAGGVGGCFMAFVFDKEVSSVLIPDIQPSTGQAGLDNIEFGHISVPEPTTISLLVIGTFSLLLVRRRRNS